MTKSYLQLFPRNPNSIQPLNININLHWKRIIKDNTICLEQVGELVPNKLLLFWVSPLETIHCVLCVAQSTALTAIGRAVATAATVAVGDAFLHHNIINQSPCNHCRHCASIIHIIVIVRVVHRPLSSSVASQHWYLTTMAANRGMIKAKNGSNWLLHQHLWQCLQTWQGMTASRQGCDCAQVFWAGKESVGRSMYFCPILG